MGLTIMREERLKNEKQYPKSPSRERNISGSNTNIKKKEEVTNKLALEEATMIQIGREESLREMQQRQKVHTVLNEQIKKEEKTEFNQLVDDNKEHQDHKIEKLELPEDKISFIKQTTNDQNAKINESPLPDLCEKGGETKKEKISPVLSE